MNTEPVDDVSADSSVDGLPTVVCIGCARPIYAFHDYCPHCSAPASPYIWLDPYKRIFAEGYVWRRMTGGRPRDWAMKVEIAFCGINLAWLLWVFLIGISSPPSLDSVPMSERIEAWCGYIMLILYAGFSIWFLIRVIVRRYRLYGKVAATHDS